MNAPTNFPNYDKIQQFCNVSNFQNQSPSSCCAHCVYGAGQFQNAVDVGSLKLSSSPAASSDCGQFNKVQASGIHDSPARHHTLGCLTLHSTQATRSLRLKTKNCSFCLKNGERQCVYGSHELKNEQGIVLCPILRRYVCGICGATGDQAHTRKYCPWNVEVSVERPASKRLLNGLIHTKQSLF